MHTDGSRGRAEVGFRDEAEVLAYVTKTANEVHDPCGLAVGMKVGLADMGLLRTVEVQRADEGWDVSIRIRFTAPECLYYFHFEESLRQRLEGVAGINQLNIGWSEVFDWSPDDLSPAAKEQFDAHHQRLAAQASAPKR